MGSGFSKESMVYTRLDYYKNCWRPASVEFFSREGKCLGSKRTLEGLIHEITQIPIAALRGKSLSQISVDERLRWTTGRNTQKVEDKAYCLLGIFDVVMPLRYGEGENAFERLRKEIERKCFTRRYRLITHLLQRSCA